MKCIVAVGIKNSYKTLFLLFLFICWSYTAIIIRFIRFFSKLRVTKNYLRSSMGEDKLNNLCILSMEIEVIQSLNFEKNMDDFLKARKVLLKMMVLPYLHVFMSFDIIFLCLWLIAIMLTGKEDIISILYLCHKKQTKTDIVFEKYSGGR